MIVPTAVAPGVALRGAEAVGDFPPATTPAVPHAAPAPCPPSASVLVPHSPYPSRYSWSELMRRVFGIDVPHCEHCGGRRRWIALITDTLVARRILRHLGLPSEAPPLAAARAPPQMAFEF
ncbi:MAG: hypothetical protein ACI8QZ_003324 [Chlamydiales bacterium]|jgi:hypothetical protein